MELFSKKNREDRKMNTVNVLFQKICSVILVFSMVAGILAVPIEATEHGIYLATVHATYKNPLTGQIEDGGSSSSEVLGQSMAESVLYQKALVEVDENRKIFVTLRLQLMDNIENPEFQIAEKGGEFHTVSSTLMQEDAVAKAADYRIAVSSENVVIRCSMHVIAMGRDVVFFATLSDFTAGFGDFVTSITVKKPTQVQSQQSEQTTQSQVIQETSQIQRKEEQTTQEQETQEEDNVIEEDAQVQETQEETTQMENVQKDTTKKKEKKSKMSIVTGIVIVLVGVAAGSYVVVQKKRGEKS